MITENIHISYCELPAEARALFTIFGLGAAARFSPTPPRKASLTATLSMIWDAERLTPGDLSDPVKMTELVEQYLAPNVPRRGPRSDSARRRHAA